MESVSLRVDTIVNPDDAVTNREVNKINLTVKQAEQKEDRVKTGYALFPKEDPTFFNDHVKRAVATLGGYKNCPVCKKQFYIPSDSSVKAWGYKVNDKPVCSYSCSRKGNK